MSNYVGHRRKLMGLIGALLLTHCARLDFTNSTQSASVRYQDVSMILPVQKSNLVGYWRMDGNLEDLSQSGNALTPLSGNPTLTSVGYVNSGDVLFQPGNSFVIGSNGNFAPSYLTASVWAKYSGIQSALTNGRQTILHATQGGNAYAAVFSMAIGNAGDLTAEVGGVNGGSTSASYVPGQVTPGVWTHLAVTYDGTSLKAYVNGELVNESAYAGGAINYDPSYTQFFVGQKWPNGPPLYNPMFFDGELDELAIWKSALSASEIKQIYMSQMQQ